MNSWPGMHLTRPELLPMSQARHARERENLGPPHLHYRSPSRPLWLSGDESVSPLGRPPNKVSQLPRYPDLDIRLDHRDCPLLVQDGNQLSSQVRRVFFSPYYKKLKNLAPARIASASIGLPLVQLEARRLNKPLHDRLHRPCRHFLPTILHHEQCLQLPHHLVL